MIQISRASILYLRVMLSASVCAIAAAGCLEPPGEPGGTRGTASDDTAAVTVPEGARLVRTLAELPGDMGRPPKDGIIAEAAANVPPGFGCTALYGIMATGSGLFVSAEFGYPGGYNGMLRARNPWIGPWETFRLCTDNIHWIIDAWGSGLWVSAELGYGGGDWAMLRARASQVGPWEQFRLYCFTDGTCAFQNGPNGLLVAAEFGYDGDHNGMLRARTGGLTVGAWERFNFVAR